MQRIAMAWFREDDWPQWRAMDPDFQPNYQHWLRRMERLVATQPAGITLVKVMIEPAEFQRWRTAFGRGVDTHDRALFAAMKLQAGDMH